jgi:hypothetical protein
MATQYWIRRNDQTAGPFTSDQIRSMASSGMLTEKDLVSDDQIQFKHAGTIPELLPNRESILQQHAAGTQASTLSITAPAVSNPNPQPQPASATRDCGGSWAWLLRLIMCFVILTVIIGAPVVFYSMFCGLSDEEEEYATHAELFGTVAQACQDELTGGKFSYSSYMQSMKMLKAVRLPPPPTDSKAAAILHEKAETLFENLQRISSIIEEMKRSGAERPELDDRLREAADNHVQLIRAFREAFYTFAGKRHFGSGGRGETQNP